MIRAQKVTLLVAVMMNIGTTSIAQAGEASMSMRVSASNTLDHRSNPLLGFAAIGDYTFYKSYAFAVDYSYLSPYLEYHDYLNNGLNDLGLFFMDKSVWEDKAAEVNLALKGGPIIPISAPSRDASMTWGASGAAILTKGFQKRHTLTYTLITDYFEHKYQTAQETEDKTIFNTRWDVINRLSLSLELVRFLHLQLAGSFGTYYDYSSYTTNLYGLTTALAFNVTKHLAFDFGVRSIVQDEHDPELWNGPRVGPSLYHPRGTLLFAGTSLEF
jgi:hypothetical protein